ncbi:MAG: Crp/Fnr family transcriptional regulator [Alloprevotella sp.]|nr:Crp/Fnr family transcriptional regulator [Alloprevotella sp.]
MIDELKEEGLDRLLCLPLLQGMNRRDLLDVAGRVRLNFFRLEDRRRFARQDMPATGLYFILSGDVRADRRSLAGDYTLSEWIPAPLVVQPEALFSWRCRYSHTFTAASSLSVMEVDKSAVRDVLFQYPAFRLNLLNYLGHATRRVDNFLWCEEGAGLAVRFGLFLRRRCLRVTGRKELSIKLVTLAAELGWERRTLSRVLHGMEDDGVLRMGRGRVEIPDLSLLP